MRGPCIGLALALIAAPVWAWTLQEQHWCFGFADTDDQAIAGCTALIQSAQETPANRAAAYHFRGLAELHKGLYDPAIADYTQAIALKSDYARAYGNRGVAYEKEGLRDPAVADFRAALKLDPNLQNARDGLTRLGATP